MPKRKIQFSSGMIVHVINRGALRMNLYFNATCYERFLQLINRYTKDLGITILALCLMPNHFHLLVRIEEGGDLSEFMKRVCANYSVFVNEMLHRKGTIFEGRFFASVVNSDAYLMSALKYIHLNPMRAGLSEHPAMWPYSNYLEIRGDRAQIQSDCCFVRSLFDGPSNYEAYVTKNMQRLTIDNRDLARDLAEAGFV